MVWYDVVVLAILAFTTWRGAQRGLVTQLAWIAAVVLCFKFANTLAPSITPHISVGEPNNPVRHWLAMFILFVGFSIASFLVARTLDNTLQKAKLKELDRFFGAIFGLAFGGMIVLVATFFAAVLEPTKAAVLESRTGHYSCVILDTIKPLTPEHFHEYFVEYQKRLPHDNHEHLGDGTSLPDFLGEHGGDLAGKSEGKGGFNLLEFGNGLAEQLGSGGAGPAGSTGSAGNSDGPTLDQLWRTLPETMKNQFGDQIQRQWSSATPQQRQNLVGNIGRSFDFEMPAVVTDFLSSTKPTSGTSQSSAGRIDPLAMLNEIGDIYQDRNQIVRRTQEHLVGIPVQVQEAVIQDWHADVSMLPDPDPLTNIKTRLDDRILRQLERARVPLTNLSYELRQRLNRSRQ